METTRESVITLDGLGELVEVLRGRGYRVVGPTLRDGAIVYDELDSAAELPAGWTEVHEPATTASSAATTRRASASRSGPHSWKQYLLPPRVRLWRAARGTARSRRSRTSRRRTQPYAFFGVRCCDLHAIAIQDRVFLGGRYVDRDYAARREGAFVVAVNCGEPGGTCFCVVDGHRPGGGERVRPRADRAARRRAPLPRRRRQRAWRRGASGCHARRVRRGRPGRRSRPRRASRGRAWAARSTRTG